MGRLLADLLQRLLQAGLGGLHGGAQGAESLAPDSVLRFGPGLDDLAVQADSVNLVRRSEAPGLESVLEGFDGARSLVHQRADVAQGFPQRQAGGRRSVVADDLDGAPQMQDGFIVGVSGGGAAGSGQRVLRRPSGLAGEAEVVGQDIGELFVPLGVEPLEDFADGAVEIDPLPPGERVVGGLVGQRMAEQVLEVRRSLQSADQANDFEAAEVVL